MNQSINQFISRHSTEARATVRLCRIKEKCLKTDLKCVNWWSSSTVQWKRVPESRSSNRETTSSSVHSCAAELTETSVWMIAALSYKQFTSELGSIVWGPGLCICFYVFPS